MLHFLETLIFEKAHTHCKQIFKLSQSQKIAEFDMFQKTLFSTLASTMNLGLNAVLVAAGQYLCRDFTFIY